MTEREIQAKWAFQKKQKDMDPGQAGNKIDEERERVEGIGLTALRIRDYRNSIKKTE